MDRGQVKLVLAAVAHAAGSHDHNGPPEPDPAGRWVSTDPVTGAKTRLGFPKLESLYPWPDEDDDA